MPLPGQIPYTQGSHDGHGWTNQASGSLLQRRRAQAFLRADQQVSILTDSVINCMVTIPKDGA